MVAYSVGDYKGIYRLCDFERNMLNVALYEVVGGSRFRIALVDERNMALNGINELVVNEEVRVPLYKQAMEMQMGKKPRAFNVSRKVIRLRQIAYGNNYGCGYKLYVARV